MLRCAQSSPEDNVSYSGDMTVLERQRAIFQRLYQPHQPIIHDHHLAGAAAGTENPFPALLDGGFTNFASLWHVDNNDNDNSPDVVADVQGRETGKLSRSSSSITAVAAPAWSKANDQNATPAGRANGTATSTRKRKAEHCLEDKKWEGETGDVQSEITVKCERETSGSSASKENKKSSGDDVQKSNYIHVRARRGQATDSHSLAERARREKISKKMKCLQDLVPGCNKVVGKAGMLDEIINYVQSLQKQVEFLSMKLAAFNPRLEFNMDNFFPKELPAYMGSFPAAAAAMPLEAVNAAFLHYNPLQQLATATTRGGGGGMNTDMTARSDVQMMPQQRKENNPPSVPIPEVYLDSSSYFPQLQAGWESDCWQSPFNGGFH